MDVSALPSWSSAYTISSYGWPRHGDEWTDQANFCKQPYPLWKQSLIDAFILPNVTGKVVLEVGSGLGRWTEHMIPLAKKVFAVDVSPVNVAHCRKRLPSDKLVLLVNDGSSIPPLGEARVDFVWSYDSFVHFKPADVLSYLREFGRLLSPGGAGVVHHSDHGGDHGRGRSYMTAGLFSEMAGEAGLRVTSQVDSWGDKSQYNCKLFGDCISTFSPA